MLEDVLAARRVVPFLLTALKYLHKLVTYLVSFLFLLLFVCFFDTNIISQVNACMSACLCVFVYTGSFLPREFLYPSVDMEHASHIDAFFMAS